MYIIGGIPLSSFTAEAWRAKKIDTRTAVRYTQNMPTKRTEISKELQDEFKNAVRVGVAISLACAKVGIEDETYEKWMLKGQSGEGYEYEEFYKAVNKAQGDLCEELIGIVHDHAKKGTETVEAHVKTQNEKGEPVTTISKRSPRDWRAAMTMLEKLYPEYSGKMNKLT